MTTIIIFCYLGLVLCIGVLSNRFFRGTGEDYFVASAAKEAIGEDADAEY